MSRKAEDEEKAENEAAEEQREMEREVEKHIEWDRLYEHLGFEVTLREVIDHYLDEIDTPYDVFIDEHAQYMYETHDGDMEYIHHWLETDLVDVYLPKMRLEHPKEVLENLSKDEIEAYLYANIEIKDRTHYGRRREEVERPSIILSWSNSGKTWNPWTRNYKAGEVVELDANQILVPVDRESALKFADFLKPLPLYKYSTEARLRDEAPEQQKLNWALKQLDRQAREKYKRELGLR